MSSLNLRGALLHRPRAQTFTSLDGLNSYLRICCPKIKKEKQSHYGHAKNYGCGVDMDASGTDIFKHS